MRDTCLWCIAAFLLFACQSGNDAVPLPDDERYGGILVLNQFQSFSTTFPSSTFELSAAEIGSHVYETLVGYEEESLEPIPLLASSWSINEDATEYRFTIREGVFFHDDDCFPDGKGRLMTPEDVLFTMRYICEQHPNNRSRCLFSDQVLGAQAYHDEKMDAETDEHPGIFLDGRDLVFRLSKPNVEFIHVLAHYNTSIFPRELLEYYEGEVDFNPVGTGAFKRKVLRAEEICVLERHTRYWGRDDNGNPLPFLDGVKIGFASEGLPVSQAMQEGILHLVTDADMVEDGDAITSLTEGEYAAYRAESVSELETVFLGFLNDEGVFADVRVRKAFGMALDMQKIADEVLNGSGKPGAYGLVPPAFKKYPYEEVKGFSQDIEQAQKLMAEAGFEDGSTFPVTTLQIQNRFRDVIVAQEIQRQVLDNLGISLSITALPRGQHFKRIEDRQTNLWLDNWIGDFIDPQNFLGLMLSRNTPEQGSSFLNIYRYKNPTYDSLVFEALKVNDEGKRMLLYCKADDLLMEDAAIVPIYYEEKQLIQHVNVMGLKGPVLGVLNLKQVYLDS